MNAATGIKMKEKKTTGAISRVQKLKKRLSISFGRLSISKEDNEINPHVIVENNIDKKRNKDLLPNGKDKTDKAPRCSEEEFLKRLEVQIKLPNDRNHCYEWNDISEHEPVKRQLSVSSDSKLLDEDICEETRVILRPKKPIRRPKSEAFLLKDSNPKRTKRHSAFGGDSPFGRQEAYIKLDQLGEGSYATVFKGYSNLTHRVVALKEIRLQEEEGAPFTAIREASILKNLKHSNIVTLHDIIHTKQTLTFVFEYVHTDLSRYMERQHGGALNHHNVKLFLFQLLRAVSYIHSRLILHRDVKPQNLLISEIGELKLADFGLARAKSVPSHTYSHEVVTLWYRPPDVLLGSTEYSTSLDMWGVGCIFVEMITGMPLFPGVRDNMDQLDKIFRLLGTPTDESWDGVGRLPGYKPYVTRRGLYRGQKLGFIFPRLFDIAEAENLANAFLQLHPDKRISAADAMTHKYFSNLPKALYDLPSTASVFSVKGIYLYQGQGSRPNTLKN